MDVAAVAGLAFVASITPGPNNVMLWSSGLNHGPRRTLRHLAGVNLGFAFLLFLVAVGLGSLFDKIPGFETGLKIIGSAYLLYLAYGIFNTSAVGGVAHTAKPMTFLQAAAFQWVNPKAWVFSATAVSTGLSDSTPLVVGALGLTALVAVINLPCILTWMLGGSYTSRFLDDPRKLRPVNRVLGILLAATVVLIIA